MTQSLSHRTKVAIVVEWVNVIATMLLLATIVLSFNYQRYCLYLYAASLLVDLVVNRRFHRPRLSWQNAVFVAMILYYLCIWIWHIFEDSTIVTFRREAENRIPFIVFGILGLVANVNPRLTIRHVMYSIMIPSLIIGIVVTIATLQYISATDGSLTFSVYQEVFAHIRVYQFASSHMVFNICLNVSVVLAVYVFCRSNNRYERIIIAACVAIAYFFLLTSEGRTGFLTSLLLIMYGVGYWMYRNHRRLLIPTIVAVLLLGGVGLTLHPRISKAVQLYESGAATQLNPRSGIWKYSISIGKERPIWGYGISDGRKYFTENVERNEKMSEYVQSYVNDTDFFTSIYAIHPHNVWLGAWLEFGIIGVILITLIFVLPIIFTTYTKRLYLIPLLGIIAMQSMFESLGPTSIPPILFAWLIYFVLLTPQITDRKETLSTDTL